MWKQVDCEVKQTRRGQRAEGSRSCQCHVLLTSSSDVGDIQGKRMCFCPPLPGGRIKVT